MSRYRLAVSTIMVCREPGAHPRRTISDPETAAAMVREFLAATCSQDDREHFILFALDTQNQVLSAHMLSTGTQSASLVGVRELMRVVLLSGAAAILIAHNHPSGKPEPSREDLRLTKEIKAACALFDIRLHDHIVVGDDTTDFVSLAKRGVL